MIRKRGPVPPDAQRMIKTAADRAGMSVGEWLNEVILDAASDEGVKNLRAVFQERTGKPKSGNHDYASIYSRLDTIAAKIEMLSQGGFDPEIPEEGEIRGTHIAPDQQTAIFDQLSELLDISAPGDLPETVHRRRSAIR